MDAVTLDQFAVFVAIVDSGSFAAAARRMNRAQSAVTYAVQKLEEQSQIVLFDRSAYRPTLTAMGQALLPRARRIIDDVADYRLLAQSLTGGLEAEVSLVVDAFAPMAMIVSTLKAFHATFPMAQARVSVESLDLAGRALSEGLADLAVIVDIPAVTRPFERHACGTIELVAVAAPDHPLSGLPGPIEPASLRDHVQLVLSNRTAVPERQEFGVHSVNCWHLTDLETKHAMLRIGLGWGSMPRHRVADDLATGRLVALKMTRWEGIDEFPRGRLVVAHRKDKALGPAARWLIAAFVATKGAA